MPVLLGLAACKSAPTYIANPGVYDRMPEAWLEPLQNARLAFDRGDAHSAYSIVAPLAIEGPGVLPVRVFLQELELQLLESEGRVGDLSAASPAEARAVLLRFYDDQAEARPLAEGYVLAARLESDGEGALAQLDEADVIDHRCVWVHYARAWWRHRLRRFKEARESVGAALKLDGGHLPTLRLHATILAGAGDYEEAADALTIWLERTRKNPLFAATERADALLDLAALEVLREEPKRALRLLEELDPRAVRDPARSEEVRAAAYEARDELGQALEALRRASELRPDALLPLVQQAILLQRSGDVEGEREVWLRLLELTDAVVAAPVAEDLSSVDFEAALYRLQALSRLERLAAPRP